jgi:hypothetical protein
MVGKDTDDEYYHLSLNSGNWQLDIKGWEDINKPTYCVVASALC